MATEGDLSFGLIGCGHIGLLHARIIRRFGRLVAVCDPDQNRMKAFPEVELVSTYLEVDDMIMNEKGLDVIVVCSPNGYHAEHSIKALKNGIHVLCEKPMAIKHEDAEAMVKAADDYSRKLLIVKQNRYNPLIAMLKNWVDNDKLGKIFSIQVNCFWNRNGEYYQSNWRGTPHLDGGMLFTQFSHFIDLLYWIFGNVAEVDAMMDNFNHQGQIDYEDTVVACMRFITGVLASLHFNINAYHQNREGSITVFGEKGTIKIGGSYLNNLEYIKAESELEVECLEIVKEVGVRNMKIENHEDVYSNFIGAINENKDTGSNLHEALKTVEIIEQIYKAARNRRIKQ